jgi:F-type H+-transporting ATPase subunit b
MNSMKAYLAVAAPTQSPEDQTVPMLEQESTEANMHAETNHNQAESHGHQPQSPMDFLNTTNVVSVLIVTVFFIWLVKKFNLLKGIQEYRDNIRKDVEAAESQKAQALAELDVIKSRVANLDGEVKTIVSEAEVLAQKVAVQMLDDAKAESNKMMDNARRRMIAQERAISQTIQSQLMRESLNDARLALVHQLDNARQERLIEQFITDLEMVRIDATILNSARRRMG